MYDISAAHDIHAVHDFHDIALVDELFRREGIDRHELRRLRNAFYKKQSSSSEALEGLPESARSRLASRLAFHSLNVEERHDSALDGATKLILRTRRGFLVEAVILRVASGRTALCVSCQIGCAAACSFCATGKMGVVRDLTAGEILDQVILSNQLLRSEGRRLRNIVFMGMGEPFHNEESLFDALDVLCAPQCFAHSQGRILISTVGVPQAMVRCARRFPRVHLALSLHSARQDVRREIVPLARSHGLDDLRLALEEVTRIQEQTVMIEYVMLAGINDGLEDAAALAAYLEGLAVHVNLIPYNPIDDAPALAPTPSVELRAFGQALKGRGFPVTVRYSLGADIAAACGQLVRRENREIARSAR